MIGIFARFFRQFLDEVHLLVTGRLVSSTLEFVFIILNGILRDVLIVFGIGFSFLFRDGFKRFKKRLKIICIGGWLCLELA